MTLQTTCETMFIRFFVLLIALQFVASATPFDNYGFSFENKRTESLTESLKPTASIRELFEQLTKMRGTPVFKMMVVGHLNELLSRQEAVFVTFAEVVSRGNLGTSIYYVLVAELSDGRYVIARMPLQAAPQISIWSREEVARITGLEDLKGLLLKPVDLTTGKNDRKNEETPWRSVAVVHVFNGEKSDEILTTSEGLIDPAQPDVQPSRRVLPLIDRVSAYANSLIRAAASLGTLDKFQPSSADR